MFGGDRGRCGARVFLALCLVVATATAVRADDHDAAWLDGLDAWVEKAMRDWGVPGMGLAIVQGDEVVLARGYGVRSLDSGEAVDENTIFAIGSSSKAFTALAVTMLQEEGKLDLDDRVIEHLPAFRLHDPYATREMRVRDLLRHNSGLSRGDLIWYGQDFDRQEVLRRVQFLAKRVADEILDFLVH